MKYENDYLDLNPTWHEEDSPRKVAELIDIAPRLLDARRVMDYGCGVGKILKILSEKNSQCSYYGYDISKIALDVAEKNNSSSIIKFNSELPTSNDFDFVLFVDILEHLESSSCLKLNLSHEIIVRVPVEKNLVNSIMKFCNNDPIPRLRKKYGHIRNLYYFEWLDDFQSYDYRVIKWKAFPLPMIKSRIYYIVQYLFWYIFSSSIYSYLCGGFIVVHLQKNENRFSS